MSERVEITLSPRPEFVSAVRHVLSALGRMAEFSADSVEDLKLAVSEAVTNAATRGARAGTDAEVRVVARRDPGSVTIEVSDEAGPFDAGSLSDTDGASSEEFSFETGLSLPVVRGLVEDLELVTDGERGLVVRFTIRSEGPTG